MSELLNLIKIQIKSGWGFSSFRYNVKHKTKELRRLIGLMLVFITAASFLMFSYVKFLSVFFNPLKELRIEPLLLLFGILLTLLFIMFISPFYILSTIFLAKDTEFLTSLPVNQRNIFASKFILVMLGEYLLTIPLMTPPGICYGIITSASFLFYVKLFILALLIPAIPLVLSSLLALLLMRFIGNLRRRNTILLIGGFIFIVGFMGAQIILTNVIGNSLQTDFSNVILTCKDTIATAINKYFPPILWAVNSLSISGARGFAYLGLFALLSIVSVLLVIFISNKIYKKGALAMNETARRSTVKYISSYSSIGKAIFLLEWKNILRVPVFAMNSLVGIIICPIIMIFTLFGKSSKGSGFKPMLDILVATKYSFYIVLSVGAILTLLASIMNPAASTVISREGKNFWITKMIPVSPSQIIKAKFLAVYSISVLIILTTSGAILFTFKLNILYILGGILIALIAATCTVITSIIIDFRRPKLEWNNPTQVIKQNINVMLASIFGVIAVVAPGYGVYQLAKHNVDVYIIFILVCLFFIALALILYRFMLKNAILFYKKYSG